MANLKPSKAVGNLRLNGSLIDNKNFSGFSGGLLKSQMVQNMSKLEK